MIYEQLVNIISQSVPQLVPGSTLFINQAPMESIFCALLRDGPGGFGIDGYMPTERSGFFVLALRGESEPVLISIMQSTMKALTISNKLTANYYIKNCRPLTEPIKYRNSVGNIREISVNFSINYGIVE